MILECPSCSTRYEIPVEVPSQGRKVRCAKCGHIWLATPPVEPPAQEPAAPVPVAPEPAEDIEDDIVFQDAELDVEPEPAQAEPELAQAELSEWEDLEPAPSPEAAEPGPPPAIEEPVETAPPPPVEDASLEEEEDWGYDPEPEPSPPPLEEVLGESEESHPVEEEESEPVAEWHSEPPAQGDEIQPAGPADEDDPLPPAALDGEAEVISIGDMRRPPRRTSPIAVGWSVLLLLLLAAAGGAFVLRADVVRALPGTARLYAGLGLPVNIRGLEFQDVSYEWSVDNGRLILEVRGQVTNITAEPVRVPAVVFNLRDDKDTQVFQWIADIRTEPLAARERARFVARIPSPPKSVRSLQVRFADGA